MGGDGAESVPSQYRHLVKLGGGAAQAEAGDQGFFARWRAYRKMLKEEYPWVRFREVKRIPEIPINYVMYRFWDHVSGSMTNRQNLSQNMVGGLADAFKIAHWNVYSSLPFKVFPRFNTMTLFSNGATDIDRMYVVEKDDYVLPIAFRKEVENSPTEETLLKGLDYVDRHGISPFNKAEGLGEFMDNDFVQRAFDKYTRGDYTKYFSNEPKQMSRWLTKDETWAIYQYGERDMTEEAMLPASVSSRVNVYKEPGKKHGFWYRMGNMMSDNTPSCWKMWWYWQMGDWLYDLVDIFFGPAEAMLRKIHVPAEGVRHIMDQEYKVVARMRRNSVHPRGMNFTYEVPGKNDMEIREAARAASDIGYN
jgi:hypothetical protein